MRAEIDSCCLGSKDGVNDLLDHSPAVLCWVQQPPSKRRGQFSPGAQEQLVLSASSLI